MKYIVSISLAMGLAACSFGGFKPNPWDAASFWELKNYANPYPGSASAALDQYPSKARRRQLKDMQECGYDPIDGGKSEADACLRKKGWRRKGFDPYPENKKYEWPREEGKTK
ncbi:TPA: hypothetical protein WGR75_000164 [Neisseria meningitidis]|uniref:hypothetical protein n=1 Tax=Neisseria meningitidis TaxID=487 RepID=UPI000FCBA2D8|nr:hypothetical protein [Neisseria meningitidis]MBW3871357.1 hypothetical protein [Neisseria meningitidis]MBW3956267.1 hypothetical protein [Neisseria meningitidis]MCL4978891.1 hypothetical protein [Neisseria meningitidis]MCL4998276.1 hypothetical protein [Neisseria meningitidis]MCL5764045.1 hypothetical protein [Neisseria meningitidis]